MKSSVGWHTPAAQGSLTSLHLHRLNGGRAQSGPEVVFVQKEIKVFLRFLILRLVGTLFDLRLLLRCILNRGNSSNQQTLELIVLKTHYVERLEIVKANSL